MATGINPRKENFNKVLKTVRGSLKKSIFYLGARIPYNYNFLLIYSPNFNIYKIKSNHPGIYELIRLDYKIRTTDDILDENLYRKKPLPVNKIKKQINKFRKSNNEFETIADLFDLELDLFSSNKRDAKEKLKKIIDLRPTDYFLLINKIIDFYGTKLSKGDLNNSIYFIEEFQRLRDLFDDIMSTEEDGLKNSYNSILTAQKNSINYKFIDKIVKNKFNILRILLKKIKKHPNKTLLKQTITFWEEQYSILFRPMLVSYYNDKEKYKKIYFMFKQI